MDNRLIINNGTVLDFPGIKCKITEYIGRGSNGIVYKGEYSDGLNAASTHCVLVKELFPYDPCGNIYRDAAGNIVVKPEAEDLYAVHRESFEYGNRIHLALLQKHPEKTGANINTYLLNNTAYTLLGYTGGQSMDAQLKSTMPDCSLKALAERFLRLLDSLDTFHSSGYLHLDISPDNILIIGNGENEQVMLIDYNSVHPINQDTSSAPIYYSTKPGYTSPEVRHAGDISAASDLYSVAAVFYRCLIGTALTPSQMLGRCPPDVSGCKYLVDQPSSVTDMVKKILKRGLAVVPKLRYGSIAEMRRDFVELSDRIDGVGITHWALWETGRNNIIKIINSNKSYEYIKNADSLYPSSIVTDEGDRISAQQAVCEKVNDNSFYLIGEGGMGKTTSLLRAVYNSKSNYSSAASAFVYVSLFGWDGRENYIRDRILENLRFKPDTRSYDVARHHLNNLLKNPLSTPNGTRPAAVILLDGLNEADGNTEALVKEILELASYDGVRFIVTSRNVGENRLFPVYTMLPLSNEDVENALAAKGLIAGESTEVSQLLRIPMMLSVYIRTAENSGKQLAVRTREQLLELYIKSLCDKQTSMSDDSTQKKWNVQAAVYYVLPVLADCMMRKKASCGDAELFSEVKKCYKVIKSRILFSAFPEWIGHADDILCGGQNADRWYGDTVQKLLWSKMGLLTRDSFGKYKVSHQLIAEFAASKNAAIQKRIFVRKGIKAAVNGVCGLLCLGAVLGSVYFAFPDIAKTSLINRFRAVDEKVAAGIINYADSAYMLCGSMYELANEVLENTDNPKILNRKIDSLKLHALDAANSLGVNLPVSLNILLPDGKVIMPGSYKPLDKEYMLILVNVPAQCSEKYTEYFSYLEYAVETGDTKYIESLKNVLDADAKYVAALYQYVLIPHVEQMDKESVEYATTISGLANIKKLEDTRNNLLIEYMTIDELLISRLSDDVDVCESDIVRYLGKYKRMLGEN